MSSLPNFALANNFFFEDEETGCSVAADNSVLFCPPALSFSIHACGNQELLTAHFHHVF